MDSSLSLPPLLLLTSSIPPLFFQFLSPDFYLDHLFAALWAVFSFLSSLSLSPSGCDFHLFLHPSPVQTSPHVPLCLSYKSTLLSPSLSFITLSIPFSLSLSLISLLSCQLVCKKANNLKQPRASSCEEKAEAEIKWIWVIGSQTLCTSRHSNKLTWMELNNVFYDITGVTVKKTPGQTHKYIKTWREICSAALKLLHT